MPKKDIFIDGENKAEIKKVITILKPENNNHDFGKTILPSVNLATVQKIIEIDNPPINNKLFEISIGIFVKGKKKIGNKTTTIKRDQKEILSKIFDNIIFLIKLINENTSIIT